MLIFDKHIFLNAELFKIINDHTNAELVQQKSRWENPSAEIHIIYFS